MRLRTQLLLAPAPVMAGALLVGSVFGVVSQRELGRAGAADDAAVAQAHDVAAVKWRLEHERAQVLRTLALLSSMPDEEVTAFRSALKRNLDGVATELGALATLAGGDAEITRLAEDARGPVGQYAQRADKAIDLSGDDPNIGAGAMKAADDSFKAVEAALAAITARAEALRGEQTESSRQRAGTTALALGLLLLGVVGVAGALASRLQRRVADDLAAAAAIATRVAEGDLTVRASSTARDEIGELVRTLGRMAAQLSSSLREVSSATSQIGHAAGEIASGNADLSQRTEQAAGSLQQTASAMEQVSGTVRRIADIIGTIDGIAFQTNILALNAAVEAARAGEQGRGFAEVASEVRSLAQRSAEAAKEIKGLIGASVEQVDSGTRLVADAGRTMDEIVASVQKVADIIGEISRAAGEQAGGLGQVNGAVASLDGMTQQNAALVEQSAAAAESLRQQAQALAGVVQRFRLQAA